MNENKLYLQKHFLLVTHLTQSTNEQYAMQKIDDLESNFCGNILTDLTDINLIDIW